MWGFFIANIFFKCKLNIFIHIYIYIYIYIYINGHSLYWCSMLHETSFLWSHVFCNVDFELIQLIEFRNKTNIEIIGF